MLQVIGDQTKSLTCIQVACITIFAWFKMEDVLLFSILPSSLHFFLFGRQVVAIVALTPHTDIQTRLELARIDAPTIEFEQRVYVCVYLRFESRLRDYACSINGAASSQGKRYKQASKQTSVRACIHRLLLCCKARTMWIKMRIQ